MMTRIVAVLFYISLFLLTVVLMLPGFVDWSQHRDKIISRIEPYLDRQIKVEGEVRFRILPSPQIALGDVTIANADGGKSPHFMTLKHLEARIRLSPLLQGRVEVESVNLSEPDIYFESAADGTPNWTGILAQNRKPSAFVGGVQLDEVTVTGGTLHYDSRITGASWIANKVDLTVKSASMSGPYTVVGTAQYKGRTVAIDVSTGGYVRGQPVAVSIGLKPDAGLPHMRFSGVVDLKNGFDAQGDIASENGKINALFDSAFLDDVDVLTENATFNAGFDFSGRRLKLSGIKASFEEGGKASGDITVEYAAGGRPQVSANLDAEDVKITAGGDPLDAPQHFDAVLDLSGRDIVWQGRKMDKVRVNASARDGAWVIKAPPAEPVKQDPPKKEEAVKKEPEQKPAEKKPAVKKAEEKQPDEKQAETVAEEKPAAVAEPVQPEEPAEAAQPPVADPAAAETPATKTDGDAIGDILNRLDAEEAEAGQPLPSADIPDSDMPEQPVPEEDDSAPQAPAEKGLPELLQDAQMLPEEEEL